MGKIILKIGSTWIWPRSPLNKFDGRNLKMLGNYDIGLPHMFFHLTGQSGVTFGQLSLYQRFVPVPATERIRTRPSKLLKYLGSILTSDSLVLNKLYETFSKNNIHDASWFGE